ncbi:hypothetical protein C0J52_05855 [Blattella germanica]|nr:hypothetical protein C0J52_05855 [Blattella germanica]
MKHSLSLLMNYFTVYTPILRVLLLLLQFTSSSIFGCINWDKPNLRVAFKLSSDREFRDLGFAICMRENIYSYTYVALQLALQPQALSDVTALISLLISHKFHKRLVLD